MGGAHLISLTAIQKANIDTMYLNQEDENHYLNQYSPLQLVLNLTYPLCLNIKIIHFCGFFMGVGRVRLLFWLIGRLPPENKNATPSSMLLTSSPSA